MKKWLPALLALSIYMAPVTTKAAGSLATRLQAARVQQQNEAEQTDGESAAAPETVSDRLVQAQPPVARPQEAKEQRDAATVAASDRVPRPPERINVAEWLNQTPDESPETQSPELQSAGPLSVHLDDYAPRVASSRRGARPAPSHAGTLTDDPLPLPPTHSVPDITSPPAAATVSDEQSVAMEPAELMPADGSELSLAIPQQTPGADAPQQTDQQPLTEPADSNSADSNSANSELADSNPANSELAAASDPVEQPAAETDVMSTEKPRAETLEITPIEPAEPKKEFSRSMLQLRNRIRYVLSYYYQRPENMAQRSPWGVMHYLIAYGVDAEVLAGRERVNAIGWMCFNQPCRGMQLFKFDGQYPVPRNGPGYQGHEGQFLHMLALSRVKSTYPMRVDGHDLTVQDLIEYEKATCRPKSELTFKLVALAHYLPSDATWTSKWGESWSIPRLIEEELAQPINGACCGGTHRLIGYSMAVKVREKRNEPIVGQWARAKKYTDAYHKHVIKLQNRDGSFSTDWLKSRESKNDLDRRVQTTGHILEWLVFSLPENELTDPRIVRAVNFLSASMYSNRQKEWEIGPRGHALRALALYGERVFEDKPGERRALLAGRPQK